MARGAARAAQSGEGANAARRRGGAATSGAAVGPGRQGVPIRDQLQASPQMIRKAKEADKFRIV